MSEALTTDFANLLARELVAAVGATSAVSIATTRENVDAGAGWVMTLTRDRRPRTARFPPGSTAPARLPWRSC